MAAMDTPAYQITAEMYQRVKALQETCNRLWALGMDESLFATIANDLDDQCPTTITHWADTLVEAVGSLLDPECWGDDPEDPRVPANHGTIGGVPTLA